MKKNAFQTGIIVFFILLITGVLLLLAIPDFYKYNIVGKFVYKFTENVVVIQVIEFLAWILACIFGFAITYFFANKSSMKYSVPISLLMLVLFAPAIFGWGIDFPLEDTENRTMAEKPTVKQVALADYFAQMDEYISDHVPFRKLWLRSNGAVKYGMFHSSLKILSMPGKDGWIYIGNSGEGVGEDPIADYEKTNLFTEEELEDLASSLQGFKNYLNMHGKEFRLMINLNKSHIYPEHLPDEVWEGEGETRAEQLISYLNDNTDIETVYPKDALLENKNDYLLYCPTDAHWNTVGGYIGFCELMKSINPEFEETSIKEINPVYAKSNWGDVANIVNAAWFTDNEWTTTSYKPDIQLEWTYRTEEDSSLYIHNENGNGQRLLVYHDSYMNQMMEYLGKEYTDSEYIEKEFNITEQDIESKNPDIVVFEVLERMLNNYTEDLRYWQKYD